MVIRHLLAALFLVVPSAALAQTPQQAPIAPMPEAAAPEAEARTLVGSQMYRFAGTQWGASVEETKTQLLSHGFTFEQAGTDGDLIFSGTVNDRPTLVVACFTAARLSKIVLSLPTDESSTLAVYREMKGILDGEYGKPEVEIETYAYPFGEGKHVGFEAAALRVGKATIGAMWQARGEALGIRISERLIVSAHYESQAWKQEVERRAQRKTGN